MLIRTLSSKIERREASFTKHVTNLCRLIELRRGRMMPLVISRKVYDDDPSLARRKVTNGKHHTEKESGKLLDDLLQSIKKIGNIPNLQTKVQPRSSPVRPRHESPEKKKPRRGLSPKYEKKPLRESQAKPSAESSARTPSKEKYKKKFPETKAPKTQSPRTKPSTLKSPKSSKAR